MKTQTHTHPFTLISAMDSGTEEKVCEKREIFKEDLLKELTGSMADRNRELVPGTWSLVRERALAAGLSATQ